MDGEDAHRQRKGAGLYLKGSRHKLPLPSGKDAVIERKPSAASTLVQPETSMVYSSGNSGRPPGLFAPTYHQQLASHLFYEAHWGLAYHPMSMCPTACQLQTSQTTAAFASHGNFAYFGEHQRRDKDHGERSWF